MKKLLLVKHSQQGFTIMEFIVAMMMLTAIITALGPILTNPQRNLDQAIKKSAARQNLNQAVEDLGNNLEKSFPMRHDFITCKASGDNFQTLSTGFETVGQYSDDLTSENIADYKVYEIKRPDQSISYYYANYDGIAAKANMEDLEKFRVVEPDRFKEGDLILISPVHRADIAALVKVTSKENLGEEKAAAEITLEAVTSIESSFGCDLNTAKLKSLKEVVESIDFHAGQRNSYIPHTFRVRNIKLERFTIEQEKERVNLYSYKWPFRNGDISRTIVAPGIQSFQVWERWLPDGEDPESEAGQFVGRLSVSYDKINNMTVKQRANETASAESIKLNATYTIRKGLRSNYEVITQIPNPTFAEPEASLTFSLIDNAKECDFGYNYPKNNWKMKDCEKNEDFYQYIKFTINTQADSPNIILNLPPDLGLICWNSDNVVIEDGTGENYGLVFNSRKSISSSTITLYDRQGFNLFCKVKPTSETIRFAVDGKITAFVTAYNRDVSKSLNTVEVEIPAIQGGYVVEPTCHETNHSIRTGILVSKKPTYVDALFVPDDSGDYIKPNYDKPLNCFWEHDDGQSAWSFCTVSRAYRPSGTSLDDDFNLFKLNSNLKGWKLRQAVLFPKNLIAPDSTDYYCVTCSPGGDLGNHSICTPEE